LLIFYKLDSFNQSRQVI